MTFMDVLKRTDGSDIHADVWWAFDTANKKEDTKIDRSSLYRADRLLQSAAEEDKKIQNILRMGFRSTPLRTQTRRGVQYTDAVALEKDKQKFITRINNLKSQIKPEKSSLDRLKEGGTLDLGALQSEQNELYEFLFEGDKQPLEKLKIGLGVRTDQSIKFSVNMKTLLQTWSKYGNNSKAKTLIRDMRENLASSAKLVQRYLLEGKGKLKPDVSKLFIPPNATFEDGWSEVREYNGKSSIDVLMEIYQVARIPVRKVGELEAGMKGVEQYYSLDIDKFVDEITKLIQTKNADPAEHYRLFFNSDNILRMIYRLIPDIIYTTNEDMSESEMKAELEKQFDALEYLIRINTLTGDFSRLKESRLKRVRGISTKYRRSPLKMNREFPNLETAWELYEEDPEKYAPEATKRRQKAPKQVTPQRIGIRSKTSLKYPDRYIGPKTLEESKTLEDKINEFSGKVKEVAEDAKSGNLPDNPSQRFRLFTSTKDKLLETIEQYKKITEAYKEGLKGLVDGSNPNNIAEDEIEEQKESLEDWIDYYEQELPELEDRIKVVDRVLENLPKQKQSLDEPSSDEATGESQ